MQELTSVPIDKSIGLILKKYSDSIGISFKECLCRAVSDYLGILHYIKSDSPDVGLERLFLTIETQSDLVLKRLGEVHKEYKRSKRQDVLLLGIKTPACGSSRYMIIPVPVSLHEDIKGAISRYPKMYNGKTTVKEIVNRAVLFKTIKNDKLIENRIYREWRAALLLQAEHNSKISLEDVVGIVSVRRKVRLKVDNNG